MRLLIYAAASLAFGICCASIASARPHCGDGAADAALMGALQSQAAAACDCCGPQRTNTLCVLSVVKPAMRAGRLSRACARTLMRDTVRACPVVNTADAACRTCNGDDDCNANEFCDCRTSSCNKTGGVCVTRPQVCPEIAAPVCGCDGMTYANDCERQAAGVCKRRAGACIEKGGCLDTTTGQCTGVACSPESPCPDATNTCAASCAEPPPAGTCFDLLSRSCTDRSCGPDSACLASEACVPVCPPPRPTGKCFNMDSKDCSDIPCGPNQACPQAGAFCNPACLNECADDADCDDGNGCTVDRCANGECTHGCICLDAAGTPGCCGGPSALCVRPCGSGDVCGGPCQVPCPDGSIGAGVCTASADAGTCTCSADCTLQPTPTPGRCGSVDTCGGSCPVVCPDGSAVTGQCSVVVVDPKDPSTSPVGPTCRCFGNCPVPATPTPGKNPCGDDPACGGSCVATCPDGSTVSGVCIPLSPGPNGPPCTCAAQCGGPPATPTPGPCDRAKECGGSCDASCPDGSPATGTCVAIGPVASDPSVARCVCRPDCPPPSPLPTPGACDRTTGCTGTCVTTCADGRTMIGKCLGLPGGDPAVPGPGICGCFAACDDPEPVPQ